jgi:hypothetical protein
MHSNNKIKFQFQLISNYIIYNFNNVYRLYSISIYIIILNYYNIIFTNNV